MSRQELADAINAHLWQNFSGTGTVDATYIGHLEQGRYRWPKAQRRTAIRHVLGAATDAELGFYVDRRTDSTPEPDVVDRSRSRRLGGRLAEHESDADLVEFVQILGRTGIGPAELTVAELACERIDQHFAQLSSEDIQRETREIGAAVLAHLARPQTLDHQRRLVTLAARVAGLRAWASFDVDNYRDAERWYALAVSAAQEAQAWSLGAWLLGARSLIPWHRRDIGSTLELIDQGIYFAGRGSDSTITAWLHALRSRGRAASGDRHGFEAAFAQAEEAAEFANERDRRHGMDFSRGLLDLRYYAGTSRLLLSQPELAEPQLHGSLAALPVRHVKARAVLTLSLADAAVQSGEIEQAVELTHAALTATAHQPIMPILQQARRVRRLVQELHPTAAHVLDEPLQGFAGALTTSARTNES